MIVFSLGGWCRQIQTGFLRSRPTQGSDIDHILTRTGLSPCAAGLPRPFRFVCFSILSALQPRMPRKASGLGSSPFARRYLGNHCYFLFLRVLRCFSSPRLPPLRGFHTSLYGGLPHSEIHGSMAICASPRLIAACHVLLRRQEPGHPLCALSNLLDFFYSLFLFRTN